MGDPEHRADGLELGRVPGPDVGQERPHVQGERAGERDAGRDDVVPGQPRRGRHGVGRPVGYHPSVTPHQTPHAFMSTEAPTSRRLRGPRPERAMPSATRRTANGAKSLLNR